MASDRDARKNQLESLKRNQLLEIAKELGISGRHLMSKHGLIAAILKEEARKPATPKGERPPKAEAPVHGKVEEAQEQAEQAKYALGAVPPPEEFPLPRGKDVPHEYGKDRLVLMVRDPYWAHAYWEITPETINLARAELGSEQQDATSILRIYDVADGEPRRMFDIELSGNATNWYINFGKPGGSFCVDVGLLARNGRFYTLARSNSITMPPAGMSDVIDEQWMTLEQEYERMYALSGGFKPGMSSAEMREMFEKRLHQEAASGAMFSMMSPVYKKPARGFWLNVDAELIVYGATEPDASVTVQGKPIQLRPDGTFTLRFALPDGKQTIDVSARSADHKEERTITPEVERRTYRPEPVLTE